MDQKDMQNIKQELKPILEEYAGVKGALIPILQHAQAKFGYLSEEVMETIADELKMSPSDIYGVATFYAQFRFTPVGKNVIKICQGTACHVGGSETIGKMLEEKLGIKNGETTKDGLFSIQEVACLGCCSLAPVCMINGTTYAKLTSDKLSKIIDEYIEADKKGAAV